jgi:hypothetical protein
MRWCSSLGLLLLCATSLGACEEEATECTSSLDCPGGRCVDGTCQAGVDADLPDSTVDTGSPLDSSADTAPAADTSVADTAVADTAVADTTTTDTSVTDTAVADTAMPECSPGEYQTCPGPGGQYCRPSRMWSACLIADPLCTGAGGTYTGCRGTGCSVCTDLLATFDCYFENHPTCVPNPTCGGMYYTCSPGCPAPTPADRCP